MPDPTTIPVSLISEFLHSALHEIGGSTGRIHRIAALLECRGDGVNEELRSWLQHMRTATTSLDDSLKAVRRYMEAFDLPSEQSTFSFSEAAEAAATALGVAIKISGEWPELKANRPRVELVLRELIDNAAKFQDGTPLDIRVKSIVERGQELISVADNGIGIEPRHSERIFKPFVRLWGDRFSGPGLGLTIARMLVQQWNGRIWLEPLPRSGSVFSFTFPT